MAKRKRNGSEKEGKRNEDSKKHRNQRDNEKEETANPFSGTNQLATPTGLHSQLLRQTNGYIFIACAVYFMWNREEWKETTTGLYVCLCRSTPFHL
jgi:hypothetical protein